MVLEELNATALATMDDYGRAPPCLSPTPGPSQPPSHSASQSIGLSVGQLDNQSVRQAASPLSDSRCG